MYSTKEKSKHPSPYITALVETALIVVLTTLPSIFGLFKTLIDSNSIGFEDLYKSGEFFLYGVSFLGSSFLVYNNFRLKQSSQFGIFSLIVFIFVILFSIIYTVTANTLNPKYEIIKILSIISLLIGIPFFYCAQVINNKAGAVDVREFRQEEQRVIEDALN